jgi:hypothetical protein
MFTMEPIAKVNSDTIVLGDTVVVRGTLNNIQDHRFSSGFMIVGNKFYGDNMKYSLIDTLAITSSKFNDYKLSLIPENKGDFKFVIQFAYRFNKSLNVDTLAFFSNEGKIFVK